MRSLLVEEQINVLMEQQRFLESHGLKCDIAKNLQEAKPLFSHIRYCCILINSEQELKRNFTLSQAFRKLQTAPIIYLGSPIGRELLEVFRQWGNDYLQRSWSREQLWSRIRQNIEAMMNKPSRLRSRTLEVDLIEHRVSAGRHRIELTPLQFDILIYLIENKGKILSMETIYHDVWKNEEYSPLETVQVNISRLRRKLQAAEPRFDFIQTIRGQGYLFLDE